MMLIEQTAVPAAALPLALLRDQLRLGTGFGIESLQDGLLETHLRAAIAAVEARIGKALLRRAFRLELPCWRDGRAQPLPLAPVAVVHEVRIRDAAGVAVVVAPDRWRLQADRHRPRLLGTGLSLPPVPEDGQAEVDFDAGFGSLWSEVPPDLAQAVLMLAAQFYETRHEPAGPALLPGLVAALVERWRNVRLLSGGPA